LEHGFKMIHKVSFVKRFHGVCRIKAIVFSFFRKLPFPLVCDTAVRDNAMHVGVVHELLRPCMIRLTDLRDSAVDVQK